MRSPPKSASFFLLIPAKAIFVSVTISAPETINSRAMDTAPFEKRMVSVYPKSAVVCMTLFIMSASQRGRETPIFPSSSDIISKLLLSMSFGSVYSVFVNDLTYFPQQFLVICLIFYGYPVISFFQSPKIFAVPNQYAAL